MRPLRPLDLATPRLALVIVLAAATPAEAQPDGRHPGGETATHQHESGSHPDNALGAPASGPIAPPDGLVWEPAGGPMRLDHLDVGFTDQSGARGVLADLVDRPVLVTFFYTRCQNSRKCPLTISRLAGLQRRLEAAGFAERVRLLAITYEPQLDTPERLARYATNRGLALGPGARAVRLDPERQHEVIDDMRVDVAYNAGWVSGHGVELNLLDAEGRLVRKYHAVSWHDPRVVEDVRQLLAGRPGPKGRGLLRP